MPQTGPVSWMTEINTSDILTPLFKLRDDIGDLDELKNSLKEHGQLIPIIVRKEGEKYRLIDGHRRWVAAKEIGLSILKTEIIESDDKEALESALIANIQRRTMDPIDEAKAFDLYVSKKGYGSASELARKLGVTPTYISRKLDLLGLPDETFADIKTGALSATHGSELSKLRIDKISEVAEIAKESDLSTIQLRKAVSFVNIGMEPAQAVHTVLHNPEIEVPKHIDKFDAVKMARQNIVLSLQKALKNVDFQLDTLGESPEKAVWVRDLRYPLHELINKGLNLQKEYDKE